MMTREYTYDPNEGEFIDFATLDDWKARDEELRAEINQLRADLAAERELADRLATAYEYLLATVEGECPSLVNEDSGASHGLINAIIDADKALSTRRNK